MRESPFFGPSDVGRLPSVPFFFWRIGMRKLREWFDDAATLAAICGDALLDWITKPWRGRPPMSGV